MAKNITMNKPNLKKIDFEIIATIVNIFGELDFIVDWKTVKGSPITVKLILSCINQAMNNS